MFKSKSKRVKHMEPVEPYGDSEFVDIDDIDDDEEIECFNIQDEFRKNSVDSKEIKILNDGSEGKVGTSNVKSKFFKNRKKEKISNPFKNDRQEANGNFIDMDGNVPTDDFVIIEDKPNRFKHIGKTLKIAFGSLAFIALTLIAYVCLSFKILPDDIKGANYKFGKFSVISRNYQPNLDELKVGDTIIYRESKSLDFIPFVLNYKTLQFKNRNGAIIFAEGNDGKNYKIQSVDIEYIRS